jgi:hypothetical protein
MSASYYRQPSTRDMLVSSKDALDVAEDIRIGANEIKKHGDILLAYPSDGEARLAVRAEARRLLRLCDDMERLQGSTVVTMDAFRGVQ